MLFLDAPAHTRLRSMASQAFAPRRVEVLRSHIHEITESLLDAVQDKGHMDVIAELAEPLPCIVTAEMLGVPVEDHRQLKTWSQDFAEMLGNFQHNPDRVLRIQRTMEEMTRYFSAAIRQQTVQPRAGLVNSLINAEIDGDRLSEEEVIANCIVTMVGGQETTTNLIGNGLLALLRHPDEIQKLQADFRDAVGCRRTAALRKPQPTYSPFGPRRHSDGREADSKAASRYCRNGRREPRPGTVSRSGSARYYTL